MKVDVAVIARPDASLHPSVAALSPTVFHAGAFGPAQARNAALAWCSADVLALLEDDVEVLPGWLEAVAVAFGDEGVAFVGGPLAGPSGTAVVSGPSPTYPSANMAFRASALRGAGGFWPARGSLDQRDWFSEEHEAQRELLRMGWRSAFAPGMAARRVGSPPGLRERLRSGARRQAVGEPRPRAVALRSVVVSGAGALLGRRRERLSRAAENLGVLVGPRVVRRELQPVARSTPFRPSIPPAVPPSVPPAGALGRFRVHIRPSDAPEGLVLLYHRIADVDDDPLGLAVTPAHFAEQLEVLHGRTLVPLEAIATNGAPRGAIAVTFDDGYADNIALKDAGIPVTLFVATGHVEEQRGFWWDAVTQVNRERQGERVAVEDRAFILGDVARRYMTQWLQPRAPREIAAALDALGAKPTAEMLTVEQVRELAQAGVTIAAHTRTHRSLRHAAPDEQRDEIERSRDDVERFTGVRPTAFSYPFGVPGDAFDATAIRIVEAAGFACAVQNDPAAGGGRFALPRHTVPDIGGQGFARWLDDAASTLPRRWRR